MLRQLTIKNLVLIEEVSTTFEEGFHAISGESGSGKSAFLSALKLILGSRADPTIIRKNTEKALVEAAFDIPSSSPIVTILEDSGIEFDPSDLLIIKREMRLDGKNRIFICNQLTTLSLLQDIGKYLIDFASQHATIQLFQLDFHLNCLDTYLGLQSEREQLKALWRKEQETEKTIQTIQEKIDREKQLKTKLEAEIEEIEALKLQEGEDEELEIELSRLSNAEELQNGLYETYYEVYESPHSLLSNITKHEKNLRKFATFDPKLNEEVKAFTNAFQELKETAYSIRAFIDHIEHNPQRLQYVSERIKQLDLAKRKYGPSLKDIMEYSMQMQTKLSDLDSLESLLTSHQKELENLKTRFIELAKAVSQKRLQGAKKLAKETTELLQSLNLPKASFEIIVSPKARHQLGIDQVEFFISPNVGENKASLKQAASGGELSRVFLALKTLTAEKVSLPTLIFDEVDANLGGETASKVGSLMKRLGDKQQLIAITHLPQVAQKASHHLQISKIEKNGRTLTQILKLSSQMREKEIARMLGGTDFSHLTEELAKNVIQSS